MTSTTYNQTAAQARIADKAWMDEVRRVCPDNANARYQPEGKGKPGTLLAALYAFRMASLAAFHEAASAVRT